MKYVVAVCSSHGQNYRQIVSFGIIKSTYNMNCISPKQIQILPTSISP
jgi:hypothetical protein